MRIVLDTNVLIAAALRGKFAESILEMAEDNKILECALSGKADLIVTADQDLIKLKAFKNIGIIHPKTLSWTFPEYFKKRK